MGTTKKQDNHQLSKHKWYLPFLPAIFIIIVWSVFSSPYFFKGLVPFPSTYLVSFFTPWNNYYGMPIKNAAMPDVITQIYPWKKLTIESLKNGTLPLWNPYQFSGNPHLANVQSAVFTPFNLLFFILPFIDAWSMLILLQPLLAAFFMYLFLKSVKLSVQAAILGSISFMFCSFIVTWMAYGTLGYAVLFLPLFLYSVERFISRKDWISTVLLIIVPPLTIFSGHFQTSLYVLIVGSSYLVMRSVSEKKLALLAKGLIYIGIGVLIASLQIIPTYKFYSQSVRSESYIENEAIPWDQLIRMVAPDFYGNPVTRNDWVGHYAEWGTYAGIIAFILAMLALAKGRKNTTIIFFAVVVLTAILFSFQPQVISLLAASKIPVLSTSTPSRIVGVISFCIAVLSGFGLDFLVKEWKDKKISKQLIAISIVTLLVLGGTWLYAINLNSDGAAIAKRNLVLPTGFSVVTIIILFVGFVKLKYIQLILSFFLVALVSVEMLRFSTKWMPFDPREYIYPELPAITYLQDNAKENRVFGLIGNEVFGIFGLYGIEGYDPLYNKRYGELISAIDNGTVQTLPRSAVMFPKRGKYSKHALDLLGVKYVIHSKGDGRAGWVFPFWEYPDSFALTFSDNKYEVYENIEAFPRAFLVNSYKIETEQEKILAEVLTGQTDLHETVLLEQEPNNIKLDDCQVINSVDEVIIESYQTTQIVMKTKSLCNSILVLSDVYYPEWVAYVDGIQTPIYRANYTFRSVSVPSGEHTVIFKYENWYL